MDSKQLKSLFALSESFLKGKPLTESSSYPKAGNYRAIPGWDYDEKDKEEEEGAEEVQEDWGSSDWTAALEMMDEILDNGEITPETIKSAAEEVADFYGDDILGYGSSGTLADHAEATDHIIKMWTRRSKQGGQFKRAYDGGTFDEVEEERSAYVKKVEKAMSKEEGYDKGQEFEQDEEEDDDVEEGCGKPHKKTMKEGIPYQNAYAKRFYNILEKASIIERFFRGGSSSQMARDWARDYDNFNDEFNALKEHSSKIVEIMEDIEYQIDMGLYAGEEEARDAGMMQP